MLTVFHLEFDNAAITAQDKFAREFPASREKFSTPFPKTLSSN